MLSQSVCKRRNLFYFIFYGCHRHHAGLEDSGKRREPAVSGSACEGPGPGRDGGSIGASCPAPSYLLPLAGGGADPL